MVTRYGGRSGNGSLRSVHRGWLGCGWCRLPAWPGLIGSPGQRVSAVEVGFQPQATRGPDHGEAQGPHERPEHGQHDHDGMALDGIESEERAQDGHDDDEPEDRGPLVQDVHGVASSRLVGAGRVQVHDLLPPVVVREVLEQVVHVDVQGRGHQAQGLQARVPSGFESLDGAHGHAAFGREPLLRPAATAPQHRKLLRNVSIFHLEEELYNVIR